MQFVAVNKFILKAENTYASDFIWYCKALKMKKNWDLKSFSWFYATERMIRYRHKASLLEIKELAPFQKNTYRLVENL